MHQYKIVASDLDGTLLNDKSEISPENFHAINELTKNGIHFVPASGRTLSEIPEELRDNANIRYIIYSNGAVVFDKETGERILTCIDNCQIQKILDILYSYESHITIRCNGESFVDANVQAEKDHDYYNINKEHRFTIYDFAIYLDDFKNFCYAADHVEVLAVYFHSYDEMMDCKKKLAEFENLRVVEGSKFCLEIVNVNAGKGNALRYLADMLNIDYSETISIGDSDNDNSIAQTAALGLAVSNACDSLKKVADKIICSNNEHVVQYVLSNFINES